MCISGCSVGTVLSAFLGRVSLSSSIISITPEPAKKLWLCVPFASMVFLIAQREDVCVCVYASMHLCKNSTSSKCMAWLDIKRHSRVQPTACLRRSDPQPGLWIPEGFRRTMMSWIKRVGCLFMDVFCFNDMAAVRADRHMDIFPSFLSPCLFSPTHMGPLHLRVDSVRDLQSVWAALLLKSVHSTFHTSLVRYCPVTFIAGCRLLPIKIFIYTQTVNGIKWKMCFPSMQTFI